MFYILFLIISNNLIKSNAITSPSLQIPMNFNPVHGSPGFLNVNQPPQDQYVYPPMQGNNFPLHQSETTEAHPAHRLSQANLIGEKNASVELVKF